MRADFANFEDRLIPGQYVSVLAKAGEPTLKPVVPQAAVDGARIRFRPVLMTAFTFILGVLPIVIATGAGAGSRRAIGTTVFAGRCPQCSAFSSSRPCIISFRLHARREVQANPKEIQT